MRQLHELISVMRLFKAGGVGLGPYAFAPTGEGSWRRVATGAGSVRPGGYRLSKSEAEHLAEFASALEVRPDPEGALAWAVDRFEMGCGRDSALEGPERPPAGAARGARRRGPGRRLAADARGGADRGRPGRDGAYATSGSRPRSSSSAR